MNAKLDKTLADMQALAERAQKVEAYDQMIAEGNKKGNAAVQAPIDDLISRRNRSNA